MFEFSDSDWSASLIRLLLAGTFLFAWMSASTDAVEINIGYLRGTGRPANAPLSGRRNPRRGGARGHRTTVISLDSALCLPLRVVLVEGRDEGKPGGLHDIRGRRPDRNPAARQLHLELDLSDRLAARAD